MDCVVMLYFFLLEAYLQGRVIAPFSFFPICSICLILPSYFRTLLMWGRGEKEGVEILRSSYMAPAAVLLDLLGIMQYTVL